MNIIKNVILHMYEFFIFVLYPLYIPNGYQEIANDKYALYIAISFILIGMFIIVSIVSSIASVVITKQRIHLKSPSLLTVLLTCFLAAILISTIFSPFRRNAFIGTPGWWQGFFTYLSYILLYYLFVSRKSWNLRYALLFQFSGSLIVYIIAILNRFQIYPIPGTNVSYFISTIGNINWYMGYVSIFLPLNAALFLLRINVVTKAPARSADKLVKFSSCIQDLLFIIYIFLGFFSIILSGSLSFLITDFVTFVFAIILAVEYQTSPLRPFSVITAMCLSVELFGILYTKDIVFHYNDSYQGTLLIELIQLHFGVIIFVIAAVVTWAIFFTAQRQKKQKTTGKYTGKKAQLKCAVLGKRLYNLIISCFASFPVLMLAFQLCFSEQLDNSWGNGRGLIWKLTRYVYIETYSWKEKIIGIGPDSYTYYLYGNPDIRLFLEGEYNDSLLTNAHSQLLNLLADCGFFAVSIYIILSIVIIIKGLKFQDNRYVPLNTKKAGQCILISLVSVTLYNMVSFFQICDEIYFYLLISYLCTLFNNKVSPKENRTTR